MVGSLIQVDKNPRLQTDRTTEIPIQTLDIMALNFQSKEEKSSMKIH